MELRRLGLKRYKGFDHETTVEIAPLTILVGANNSGKTALARAIYLLSSNLSLPDGDSGEQLILNSGGIRHGRTFEDLVTRRAAHGELSLSVVLGNGSSKTSLLVKVQNIVSKSKPSESKQQISCWSLNSGKDQFEVRKTSLNEQSPYKISVSGVAQDEQQISWRGLLPRRSDQLPGWANEQVDAIKKWASGVRYLKCPRSFPSSRLERNESPASENYAMGGIAPWILAADDDLRDSVGEWYRNVFGVNLNITSYGNSFNLTVGSQAYGTKVLLEQSGAGLVQVLPVAVTALTASQEGPGVDIIEHPEADLHPKAHASVAELLLSNLPGPERPVIIETHSEMILLRARRWIAEGRLPADHVLVYWIDTKLGRGSILRKITISGEGTMSSWPEGVFTEDYEEVLAIRRAVRVG